MRETEPPPRRAPASLRTPRSARLSLSAEGLHSSWGVYTTHLHTMTCFLPLCVRHSHQRTRVQWNEDLFPFLSSVLNPVFLLDSSR